MNATTAASPMASSDRPDEMLTKKELAAKLKVTVRTIENWQADGLLPYLKISSVVLFHWPDVIHRLNSNFRVCRRGTLRPNHGI